MLAANYQMARHEEIKMHSQNPVLRLVLCSDTRPTRYMLAIGAFFWTVGLLVPGDTMSRPSFAYMGSLAPEPVWTVLWAIYGCGMFAYSSSRVKLPGLFAFTLNCLGLALWSIYCLAILVATSSPWPAGLAADGAMFMASFWMLIRSGASGGERRGD